MYVHNFLVIRSALWITPVHVYKNLICRNTLCIESFMLQTNNRTNVCTHVLRTYLTTLVTLIMQSAL